MNFLPRELIQIVSVYLDYRAYYALSITNKKIHSVLTSGTSLRSYFQEKELSLLELYIGVQHMATHLYLRCEDIDGTMKVTTLDDHRKILLPFPYHSSARRDIFYRLDLSTLHNPDEEPSPDLSPTYKHNIQDVFYSDDAGDNVYLYRNGDIELHGEIYPCKGTELLGFPMNENIFYRNQEGYYCLLSYDGVSSVHLNFPHPTTIKNAHCWSFTIIDGDYLHLESILYHNGDLYCLDGGRGMVKVGTNVNKVVYWDDDEYWMLSKNGRVVFVQSDGYQIYTYPCTSVTDIEADEHHLYVLEEGRRLFTVDKDFKRKKIYEVRDVCDTLTLYKVEHVDKYHTIVCLH